MTNPQTTDKLRMDYINSLPQPFLIRFAGDKNFWPVHDIDVESGCLRIDVCGLLECRHIGEAIEFLDADSNKHDPETFYSDYAEVA